MSDDRHPLTNRPLDEIQQVLVEKVEIMGDSLIVTAKHQSGNLLQFKLSRPGVLDAYSKIAPMQSQLVAWALKG